MPTPSWENVTDFFTTDDDGGFAVVATLSLADGSARDISVIYDEPFYRASLDGGGGIDGADYCITAAESDIAGLQTECAVRVAGKQRYVLSIEPDGSGICRVYLASYQASPFDRKGGRL